MLGNCEYQIVRCIVSGSLPGSPAIDAGDASIDGSTVGVRWKRRERVFGGRVDGAVESQPIQSAAIGDYNRDSQVNSLDYTVWRNSLARRRSIRMKAPMEMAMARLARQTLMFGSYTMGQLRADSGGRWVGVGS